MPRGWAPRNMTSRSILGDLFFKRTRTPNPDTPGSDANSAPDRVPSPYGGRDSWTRPAFPSSANVPIARTLPSSEPNACSTCPPPSPANTPHPALHVSPGAAHSPYQLLRELRAPGGRGLPRQVRPPPPPCECAFPSCPCPSLVPDRCALPSFPAIPPTAIAWIPAAPTSHPPLNIPWIIPSRPLPGPLPLLLMGRPIAAP